MHGYLDGVSPRTVRGWAVDIGGNRELIFLRGGNEIGRVIPNLPRHDLKEIMSDDYLECGFICELNQPIEISDEIIVINQQGEHISGSPYRVTHIEGNKIHKALSCITKDMQILEIGPSYSPIAPRSQGWNSYSLDHATQQELKNKYKGQQDIDNIEEVDFVWRGGLLENSISSDLHGSFDAIIVSHVIEHFPDPISFYQSAAKILRDNGVISLVVPDKRVMFDFFKPITMTSDILNTKGRTRHSRKTAFDNVAYNTTENGQIAWLTRAVGDFASCDGLEALRLAKRTFLDWKDGDTDLYIDFHHTIYTPSSFELLILELGQLGEISFEKILSYPTFGCEFYVTLRKTIIDPIPPAQLQKERFGLLKKIIKEQAEQARWLLDD